MWCSDSQPSFVLGLRQAPHILQKAVDGRRTSRRVPADSSELPRDLAARIGGVDALLSPSDSTVEGDSRRENAEWPSGREYRAGRGQSGRRRKKTRTRGWGVWSFRESGLRFLRPEMAAGDRLWRAF